MTGAGVSAPEGSPEPLWGPNGLVPAIVQDAADGRVLMLAWMDAGALRVTLETGIVHFHSRARDRLWRKGETSGHELRLLDLSLDCDADALLLQVDPIGPTCHRGTRSCFDADGAPAERPHECEGCRVERHAGRYFAAQRNRGRQSVRAPRAQHREHQQGGEERPGHMPGHARQAAPCVMRDDREPAEHSREARG